MTKIGEQLGPLPHHFSAKSPDPNFEIAILFSIVEKANNYVFEDDLISNSPGGRSASYEVCPLFTNSVGYSEVYINFHGRFFLEEGREVT